MRGLKGAESVCYTGGSFKFTLVDEAALESHFPCTDEEEEEEEEEDWEDGHESKKQKKGFLNHRVLTMTW